VEILQVGENEVFSSYNADLAPEPGKRALVLGVNGFGNLSGVIGSQLFRKSYAPEYLV
jgi:hypothetical protein